MREYLVALLALDGHIGQLAKTAGREGQAGPRRPALLLYPSLRIPGQIMVQFKAVDPDLHLFSPQDPDTGGKNLKITAE